MRKVAFVWVVASMAVAGCTVRYSAEMHSLGPGGAAAVQVSVSSGSPLGNAIIVGMMLADGARYSRRAPPPDPGRVVNIQDCTRPVDPNAGNLLCR